MEEDLKLFMLTILKNDSLFANVYKDEQELEKDISFYKEKYPLRLFRLEKVSGLSFDLAVIKEDDKMSVALEPQKFIPDDAKNVIKCKKKELDIKRFL